MESVSINALTLCHKNSSGWVKSTLPDVCKSPVDPVPYTNTAYSKDLQDGTTTVLSNGDAMCGILGSRFFPSYDDEPGTGGGVISGVNQHQATWLSWSPDVFFEGRPVTRLTDKMLMNRGNTVSLGGYYTGPITGPQKEVLEKTCEFACACKKAGTFSQRCIDQKMQEWAEANGRNITPGGAYAQGADGSWAPRVDGAGNQMRGGPQGTRMPDYTDHDTNSFGETKLPRDRYRGNQNDDYNEIKKDTGRDRNDINFKKDCDCGDEDGNKSPVTVPKPQTESEAENESWWDRNKGTVAAVGVGVVIVGAVGLAAFTGGTSLAALAAL